MKKAFITGITGQDGYYLAKLLLTEGYIVHGAIRRSSNINTARIDPLISEYGESGNFNLHYSDLLDSASLSKGMTIDMFKLDKFFFGLFIFLNRSND